jgi:hypothetical protein
VLCAAVAVVAAGGAGAGASDPALASRALLPLSDFPSGWSVFHDNGPLIGSGLPSSKTALGAMCKRGFLAMERAKPTASSGLTWRGPIGLPTAGEAVVMFHSPSAARRAYRALSAHVLAACQAAAIKEATPPGWTFKFTSRYVEPVTAAGTHTAIYGWNAVVGQGGKVAPARFEAVGLLHGRSFAFMYFGSDLAGRQVAGQGSLINLAARRLP